MRSCTLRRATLLLVIALAALPLAVYAGKETPATIYIFEQVVDEQNTTAFYGNGTTYCGGSNIPLTGFTGGDEGVGGDLLFTELGPTTAYGFGGPWTLATGLASSKYNETDAANCDPTTGTCVVSGFLENNDTLNLNTRSTPRKISIDLTTPCPGSCGSSNKKLPASVASEFSTSAAKISVSLPSPWMNIPICSSAACPEAQMANTSLWFDDPSTALLTWKVFWGRTRVLRMSSNTWYVLGDSCDGTSTAAVYKTENQRHGSTSFQGYWIVPIFFAATLP